VQAVKASVVLVCTYGILALAYICKFTVQSVEQKGLEDLFRQ